MSHRLQVLVPEELDTRIRKAAQRSRLSIGAWVRRAVESALRQPGKELEAHSDPLARLASLEGPTGEIEQIASEIEAGRR